MTRGASERAELPLDSVLAEGNIRSFWSGDEHSRQLMASVRSIGIVEPVVVVPLARRSNGHRYQLVAGFRRYAAACEIGLETIPAVIRRGLTEAQVLEIRLVENLQRLDMNPVEEAKAVREYQKQTGLQQEDIGRKIGRSGTWVSLRLGLLELPSDVQDRLASGELSVAHANAMIPYAGRDPDLLRRAAKRASQLAMGPWRTVLLQIMSEAPRNAAGPWSRDLCLCTCSCCARGPHADVHRGRKELGYT